MTKTELHNVTKTPFSYAKATASDKDKVSIRNLLTSNSRYYTSDWQIQKSEKQPEKEKQYH